MSIKIFIMNMRANNLEEPADSDAIEFLTSCVKARQSAPRFRTNRPHSLVHEGAGGRAGVLSISLLSS